MGISCELFQRWPAMRSCDDEAGPRRPRTHIKVVLLAAAAILSAPKGDSTFVTSAALVNRVGVRAERVPSRSMQAISGEDPVEPDFDDDDDDDEEGAQDSGARGSSEDVKEVAGAINEKLFLEEEDLPDDLDDLDDEDEADKEAVDEEKG
mmetsp:Transcript_43251/g.97052  ORF Transcript_43251/g.97052 Transcript_43251/m.97052 type:complete len:150 (+) Transcript_43251:1-450(+)